MNASTTAPLKRGAIEAALTTPLVTDATREALRSRLDWMAPPKRVLSTAAFATLQAVCERLIPQAPDCEPIDLASRLDASLAEGRGDGWRFDDLPPDAEAIELGLVGIEQAARAMFDQAFIALSPEDEDRVLAKVQDGSAPGVVWATVPPKRVFEELLGQLATLFYAHPRAQEAIGYIGMADAEGFWALGLNQRDLVENEASDAPL